MEKKKSVVVPVIGCLIVQLCVGIIYLWSIFKNPVRATLGMSASAATMVSSYMLFAFVLGNLLGGVVNDKKGPRVTAFIGVLLFSLGVGFTGLLTDKTIGLLNLTYCVMGGMGSGFAYGACVSCIQKWMPDRCGLASGLAVSAFGLSTVVFTPLSNWLMDVFKTGSAVIDGAVTAATVDFRSVFLILAAVFLVLGLAGCACISLPEGWKKALGTPKAASAHPSLTLSQAIKTAPFWCIFFCIFFINGTWNLTVPLIKTLGQERGLTEAMAVFAVSFTGVPNAAGRLVMATLSDKIGRLPTLCILAVMTMAGALLMTFVAGVPYIVTVALIAFAYGGPSALFAALTTDFFGPEHSGTNYGILMLSLGFSSVFFNAVSAGVLGGAAAPTFIMAAVTAVAPIFLIMVIKRCQRKRRLAAGGKPSTDSGAVTGGAPGR